MDVTGGRRRTSPDPKEHAQDPLAEPPVEAVPLVARVLRESEMKGMR